MIDWSEGPQYASDFVKILKSFRLVDSSFSEEDTIPEAIDGINAIDAISNLGMAVHKAMARLKEASILLSSEENRTELHDQWEIETKSLISHLNYLINGKITVNPEPDQDQRNQEVIDLMKAIQTKRVTHPESVQNASDPKSKAKVLSFNGSPRSVQ